VVVRGLMVRPQVPETPETPKTVAPRGRKPASK